MRSSALLLCKWSNLLIWWKRTCHMFLQEQSDADDWQQDPRPSGHDHRLYLGRARCFDRFVCCNLLGKCRLMILFCPQTSWSFGLLDSKICSLCDQYWWLGSDSRSWSRTESYNLRKVGRYQPVDSMVGSGLFSSCRQKQRVSRRSISLRKTYQKAKSCDQ